MNLTHVAKTHPKPHVALAATAFSVLVLELALIRWLGTQIRIAAYFTNLVLLATFVGLGLGVGMARSRPGLGRWAVPVLALISLPLGLAQPLGLTSLTFPDPAVNFWSVRMEGQPLLLFIRSAVLVTVCFWAIAAVFVCIGTLLGRYFEQIQPLRAYAADLTGSLLGVILMALLAAISTPPPVWIALGVLPLVWLVRDRWSVVGAAIAVAAAAYSITGATFSPYNRIDLQPGAALQLALGAPAQGSKEWTLQANRDYHQRMLDLRPFPGMTPERDHVRRIYELPFTLATNPAPTALVVGAGTGNDVAAALRRGFARVVSIDIDPAILRAGVQLHPEKPYADARVQRVADDARAYFGRSSNNERFDVVCYGLLDSHALFSSMSSLRLDNFVYTKEGLAEAWSRVKDDGILSVSFSVAAGPWMSYRMTGLVEQATGLVPIVIHHQYDVGATFLAGRNLTLERVRSLYPDAEQGHPDISAIRIPTDDWPFLYLRPAATPWTYLTVFTLVALTAGVALRRVFGRTVLARGRFDVQMFLLGAAFLLLETRAVTQLSLLFGSTWIVNTSVFGGVLAMVLIANAVAGALPTYRRLLWYALLIASVLAVWAMPWRAFFGFDLAVRAALAGLAVALPVFFAGIVFSSELRDRSDVAAALGSNLCGALVGGLLENLSMLLGLKAIVLLALAMYLLSLHAAMRGAQEVVEPAAT